jgi:putative NADH-flavin reductase
MNSEIRKPMRLAMFGATGTVGTTLLAQTRAAGHDVQALVRDPSRLDTEDEGLTAVQGDVKDPEAVALTLKGCDAVLSTLGATGPDDPDTRRVGISNVMSAMHDQGIARLVVMGGFHVHVPGEAGNLGQTLALPLLVLGKVVIADTTGMAALVLASDLEWTFVRSPRVVDGDVTRAPRIGTLKLGPWSKVTRGDIAHFMLHCVESGAYVRRAPMVSS